MPRAALSRRTPFVLIALAVSALLVWYVVYTQQAVTELRRAAQVQGQVTASIVSALADTSSGESALVDALFKLGQQVRESGVPLVWLDPSGAVADTANLPFRTPLDSAELRAYITELAEKGEAITSPGAGTIYVGDSRLVRGLATIPLVQAGAIGLLLLIGIWGLRERGRAEREKVWAGMARESAHQLGTPLSSLAGWVELLQDDPTDTAHVQQATRNMTQDLARLDRVAHRFERIGRPPRSEPVELGAMVERLASYFAARVPKIANPVIVRSEQPDEPLTVPGDAVLLEWVLEVLTKNAIDALGGRGGEVVLSVTPIPEGGARIRVQDDGPGVPRSMRTKIFEAGYSTKERGWGIGLALARRIVEENHGGTLLLAQTRQGAAFDVILRA